MQIYKISQFGGLLNLLKHKEKPDPNRFNEKVAKSSLKKTESCPTTKEK